MRRRHATFRHRQGNARESCFIGVDRTNRSCERPLQERETNLAVGKHGPVARAPDANPRGNRSVRDDLSLRLRTHEIDCAVTSARRVGVAWTARRAAPTGKRSDSAVLRGAIAGTLGLGHDIAGRRAKSLLLGRGAEDVE